MSSNLESFFLDEKKHLDSLPILGTSALEQFLHQDSERMRMSPDSTMPSEAVNSVASGPMSIHSDSSCHDQVPDSTTSELAYDSDAFNSEDSCSSFAEAQQMSLSHIVPLSPPQNSIASPSNANLLLLNNNEDVPKRKKNLKKAKKAGDTLLKCELCDYSTRFKEHLTSHMHTHATTRNYMCSDCGQTFKWSHSLKRHQRTHAPSSDFRYTCNFCFKTFQRKDHLSIHESLHTSTNATFPCTECGRLFYSYF